MSQDLTTTVKNSIPAGMEDLFDVDLYQDDLTEGVSGGFPVLSIRASKWRIKHGGEEQPLLNSDGEAMPSIPVVMVKASSQVSKIYYAKKYEEGDDSSPDCYSLNGVTPDPASPQKQCDNCAACPQNQWGSRVTDSGKKAKACSDNRRVAVVPCSDGKGTINPDILRNEAYGGPMLLRVPPASLQDLATFGRKIKEKGFPYNLVATRVGFDIDASYPKLTFKAIRPLTPEEVAIVGEYLRSGAVDPILETPADLASGKAAAEPKQETKTVDTDWEMPGAGQEPDDTPDETAEIAKAAKAAKVKAAKAAKAAKVKADAEANEAKIRAEAKTSEKAISKAETTDSLANDLDDIMGELDSLG